MASRVLNILLRTSKQPATKSFGYKCASRFKAFPVSCKSHTRGVKSSSCSYRNEIYEDDGSAAPTTEPVASKKEQEPLEYSSEVNLDNESTPTTIRSTLPINILQTGAPVEDSRLMESLVLGPNQRLAVPWPSYSEKVIVKKSRQIVYPPLPEVRETPKSNTRRSGMDLQKRGISRLHGASSQEEVMPKPSIQNSSAVKANGCSAKINGDVLMRYSSSYHDRPECQPPKKKKDEKVICKASIRKTTRPKRRSLPIIKASDCPCLQSEPATSFDLKRLKKRYTYPDPVRICRTYTCADNLIPRADAGLRVRRKDLPSITPGQCPCSEEEIKDAPKLSRPKFRRVKEPKRICYTEAGYCETIPRADRDDWEYVYPKICDPHKKDEDQ